jgi:hypothetical protein
MTALKVRADRAARADRRLGTSAGRSGRAAPIGLDIGGDI